MKVMLDSGCTRCRIRGLSAVSRVVFAPDRGAQRLADSEADAHSQADNEEEDEDLGDETVPVAHLGHAGAAALNFGGFGPLLPVVLSWPNLAVALTGDLYAFAAKAIAACAFP